MPDPAGARDQLAVLQLCSLTSHNGTLHLAAGLSRALAAAGHRVIVGCRRGSAIIELARAPGVEFDERFALRAGLAPRAQLADLRRLRALVAREGVEIVQVWQSAETWLAAAALPGSGAALVRTRAIVRRPRWHPLRWALARAAAATLVTCERIAEQERRSGTPAARIHRLREGVDVARFRPAPASARRELRAELGLGPGDFAVANVGRLEPVKGQANLLRALAALPPAVVGLLIGDGSRRAELEGLARELGLGPRARFLGRRADVERVLAASDTYVLASTGSEGSSRATLEAMAAGLAVVASDVGSLPDLVQPGVSGALFAPGDWESLAGHLHRLAQEPELARSMGRAARGFVERQHAEPAMAAGVEEVYRAALASRRGARRAAAAREAHVAVRATR